MSGSGYKALKPAGAENKLRDERNKGHRDERSDRTATNGGLELNSNDNQVLCQVRTHGFRAEPVERVIPRVV